MAANGRHGSRGIEVVTDEMLHEVNKNYFGHESFRGEQANEHLQSGVVRCGCLCSNGDWGGQECMFPSACVPSTRVDDCSLSPTFSRDWPLRRSQFCARS